MIVHRADGFILIHPGGLPLGIEMRMYVLLNDAKINTYRVYDRSGQYRGDSGSLSLENLVKSDKKTSVC